MFDLIDDLSTEIWEDKETPPDDLTQIGEIGEYMNYHIVNRKLAPSPLKHIEYVVVDDAGKNAKTLLVEGLAANADPLKNVRHFRAKIVETEDGKNVVTAILLDMDWCIKR